MIEATANKMEMKANEELQKDVQEAIKWEPSLHSSEIGVTAKDGIVTLTGLVDSYFVKLEVEDAARNVSGVRALIENIEIRLNNSWNKSNADIASEALAVLKQRADLPSDQIKVEVEDGWITLDGVLSYNYQKEAARNALIHLKGVTGISNNIQIKSESTSVIEQRDIEKAIERNSALRNQNILVHVSGNKVTLTGTVFSWYHKDEASRIVWNTPGLWTLDNEIIVNHEYPLES